MLYSDQMTKFAVDAVKLVEREIPYPVRCAVIGKLDDGDPFCSFVEKDEDGWTGCIGHASWFEKYHGDPEDNHFDGAIDGHDIWFEDEADLIRLVDSPKAPGYLRGLAIIRL